MPAGRLIPNAVLAVVVLLPASAMAGPTYEERRLQAVLQEQGLEVAAEPEGRVIEFIRIVRKDAFIESEPWPTAFNALHWLTVEEVVTRELLFGVGQPWVEEEVLESARNLRARGFFSFVRIAAVTGSAADRVGVLVHTRDRWSLRPEPDYQVTGGTLDRLLIELAERNFLGRAKQATLRFLLVPFTFDIGERYVDKRLFGSAFALRQKLDVVFNRGSGAPEGVRAEVSFGLPFYTVDQRWSFAVVARYTDVVSRDVQGGELGIVRDDDGAETDLRPVFDDRSGGVDVAGKYRLGEDIKHTFTVGVAYADRHVAPNDETRLASGSEAQFVDLVLPEVRREVYPYVAYDLFVPDFVGFENLTTFGVTETVRAGPSVVARFGAPLRAFGSSGDSLTLGGRLGYVLALGDGLLEARVEADARREDGRLKDQRLLALLRGATPRLWFARLVVRAQWQGRWADTSKEQVALGGNNGLRGFGSNHFARPGGHRLIGNAELRTVPAGWRSVQLGGVLFYDVGAVYADLDDLVVHHAVGVGLRLVLPQIEPLVFRFDLGVALEGGGSVMFTAGLGQAIKLLQGEE